MEGPTQDVSSSVQGTPGAFNHTARQEMERPGQYYDAGVGTPASVRHSRYDAERHDPYHQEAFLSNTPGAAHIPGATGYAIEGQYPHHGTVGHSSTTDSAGFLRHHRDPLSSHNGGVTPLSTSVSTLNNYSDRERPGSIHRIYTTGSTANSENSVLSDIGTVQQACSTRIPEGNDKENKQQRQVLAYLIVKILHKEVLLFVISLIKMQTYFITG